MNSFDIFKKQVKIYWRLQKNHFKFVKEKTFLFYIFTMPAFGFIFFLIAKLILFTKSKFFIRILSLNIFKSSIRFLDPEDTIYLSHNLPSYNNYKDNLDLDKTLINKKLKTILDELNEDGFSDLGIIFSKEICNSFIQHLKNKKCFNSQTQLQSNGVSYNFDLDDPMFSDGKNAYYSFEPSTTYSFKPLKDFIENKDLQHVINHYLGFKSSIYFSSSWYNPTTNEKHYVHRLHRDYDDYKFLGLTIYWNEISMSNGPLEYVPKSNKNKLIQGPSKVLTGLAGQVFITDNFGLHRGNKVKEGCRYTTTIRYGKYFNPASVNNGFLS